MNHDPREQRIRPTVPIDDPGRTMVMSISPVIGLPVLLPMLFPGLLLMLVPIILPPAITMPPVIIILLAVTAAIILLPFMSLAQIRSYQPESQTDHQYQNCSHNILLSLSDVKSLR